MSRAKQILIEDKMDKLVEEFNMEAPEGVN